MAKGTSSKKKTAWKGIQKKPSEIKQQEGEQVVATSRASISSDDFEDAVSDDIKDEDETDEDDDYFQDEDPEEDRQQQEILKMKEMAIQQDKQRYLEHHLEEDDLEQDEFILDSPEVVEPEEKKPEEAKQQGNVSLILSGLQNHNLSDDESDNESLKDPTEHHIAPKSEALKEIVIEEIHVEQPTKEDGIKQDSQKVIEQEESPKQVEKPTKGVEEHPVQEEKPKQAFEEVEHETKEEEPLEQEIEAKQQAPATYEPIPEQRTKKASASEIHVAQIAVTEDHKQETQAATQEEGLSELSNILENLRPMLEKPQPQHLASLLPAVEESVKTMRSNNKFQAAKIQVETSEVEVTDTKQKANKEEDSGFQYAMEDTIDMDMFKENVIAIQAIDPKEIPVNILKPHEQEVTDEPVRQGMKYLFDNKFMKAKSIFQTKSSVDPLYALGLGAMAFIKAMMTYQELDIESAMNALATAYTIAKTQIDNSSFKKPFKDTVSQYLTTLLSSNNTGLPSDPPSHSMPSHGSIASPNDFIPNGVLRAHVVKAECCLLMGILQMSQESVIGYLKCGLNIRRAYYSYSIVWQEYKRMGQEYTKYMDKDTVSAIQFGIGAVHLILSSMPPKILKIFSSLGWKSDKQLGFALLKLCQEGQGIRSPLASLTLLAYYSILTSFAPQLYSKDMMNPAIECLLEAQSNHPNSCFFLFFAARIARVAKNIPLSTQSFIFASESSRGEWAEVAMKQLSDYEIGLNLTLQLDWTHAANYFEQLSQEKYWSPAFCKYFAGACYDMLGQRTEAILAFAEVLKLANEAKESNATGAAAALGAATSIGNASKTTYADAFVMKKAEFFEKNGYQDMDFSLPALELLLVMNTFEYMEKEHLETCLDHVQRTLEKIYERERLEYNTRLKELAPATSVPDYNDQRAVLLLTKASILNSLGRYSETIPHLNWILDHKEEIKQENWIQAFTYWESGVTSWGLGNYKKSRKLWQSAMACTKYDFEYRMAIRLSLALSKCDEVGVPHINEKEIKNAAASSRKRMPVLIS